MTKDTGHCTSGPIFSNGRLRSIMIRIENEKEGSLYQYALKRLGIYSTLNVSNRSLTIHRFNEVCKVAKINLFSLHKERKKKLIYRGLQARFRNIPEATVPVAEFLFDEFLEMLK